LFQAIADEDEGAVRRLSSGRREDLDHITDSHGETALSRAARCKSSAVATSLCEILIAAGASPTAKTANHGRTPLILMVMYRGTYYQKVAELLRPSINMQDKSGSTALMYAAEGAGLFASRQGNLSVARNLMTLGANPLIEDGLGRNALGHAIASNDKGTNEEMVRYLKDKMTTEVALREFKTS
jgi:ankyrin repeat protein